MIVRKLEELEETDRDVAAETWRSRRLLVAKDGMGVSLHDTLIHAGTSTSMWYRHHVEAVYCVEGEGSLEDLGTGEVHVIRPGTMYALDRHEKHVLRARTSLRMVCVFNPPVRGDEVHDEDGAYRPATTEPPG
jgi:L-ectoine synthase